MGAQSAFILRQGLMRAHLASVVAICALIDAVFIFASVSGLQALTTWFPWLTTAVLWFGVAFLSWYALQSARRAWSANGGLAAAREAVPSRRAAMLGALGFAAEPAFLAGHGGGRLAGARLRRRPHGLAAGALTASLLWLAVLSIGSRLFAPFFASASAWRVLDGIIAVIMAALAVSLALKGI